MIVPSASSTSSTVAQATATTESGDNTSASAHVHSQQPEPGIGKIPSGLAPDLQQVMSFLEADRSLARNLVHREILPAQSARYAPIPEVLDARLVDVLKQRGIEQLYTHQSEAIEQILAGKHTTVVTPTASGKSLCYTLPLLHTILNDPTARALCLFPTKALSHDQLNTLLDLSRPLDQEIKIHTFDGDTPGPARRAIRNAGQVVVTNPDMLHSGILPHHTIWLRLFENLKYIVIDEVHTYRGVFGSHVANVIRRLRRLCKFYGSEPTIICCSATIANPRELCEELTGLPFELVDKSGAPRGAKVFYFYNPPVVNKELGIRRGMIKDARRVATRFLSAGMQTIVFCRSRGRVEILTSYLKRAMAKLRQSPDRVRGYRGGYLPAERRAIERGIKSGDILGVVSTNALEMGIDIGQLRVCVMAGYPGTIASAWQQSGRAGRSSMPAVVVMVGSSAPLDQYLLAHPEYFFGTSPEQAIINPENVSILANHIKCAAFELPFQQGETFGPHDPTPVLEYLQSEGLVRQSGERFHWSENAYPAEDVSLLSPSPSNFLVKDITRQNKTIAEVDYWGAAPMLHTEAIYIHDGKTYHVDKLDWDRRMAFVQPIKTQYYTDAVEKTDIRVLDIEHETLASDETQAAADASVAWWPVAARRFGEITVQTVIAKYKKVLFDSHESIGHGDVYVPMQEMQTECYWLTFSDDLMTRGRTELGDPTAALFGLANILNNVLPLLVMCAPRDVRTVAMVKATHDNKPAIYIYDNYPGGIGLVRRAFAQEKQLLQMAEKLVTGCRCPDGCPSCVGPVLEIGRGGKAAVVKLLKLLQTAK